MKGMYKVTARRAGKTISGVVYGNINEKDRLLARLMNHHKIVHSQRLEYRLQSVELIKDIG